MADGRIVIDTKLDSSGAEKGITGLSSKLGSIAKTGLTAFTGLVAGASAAIGTLGAIGVKYNSQLEQHMSSFTTMLGSADKATKHLNELKEFAAKTPFELGDLAQASTTLQAFGTDVNKITPTLKMLGDISLGNKEKFNGLALVFGQVQSQGKLMGQDLMQMINNGFNPLQIISEKTGKSMAELKDEMSEGKISFEMVAEAMKIATSEGGKFYNAMEGQSKTLVGQWSTLKDNAKALAGEVFVPLSDGLKNSVLPTVNGYVDTLSEALKEKGVTGLVGAVGDVVASIITNIATYLPKVVDLAVQIIQNLITGLQNNLPLIVGAALKIITSLVTAILTMIPQLLEMGMQIIVQLAQGIAEQLPTLIPLAIQCIMQLITTFLNNMPLIIDAGLQLLQGLATGIINAIPQLIAMLPQVIDSMINFITEALPMILESGLTILLALIDGIIQCIPQLIAMLPTIIETILTFLTQNLPEIIDMGIKVLLSLIDGLVNAIPQLIAMLPRIINTIVNTLLRNLPQIIEAGIQILIALTKGLIQAIPKLISAIPEIVAAIFKAFKDVNWLDIGVNIISGISSGITNSIKDMVGSAIKACKELKDNIKSFFGIHSPSRVMRDEVGKYLSQGIGVGFEDESANLQQDMENSLSSLTAKMQATVDFETAKTTAGVVANSNYKSNPQSTITNNDNGITQNISFNQPVESPAEAARALKKAGRSLVFG